MGGSHAPHPVEFCVGHRRARAGGRPRPEAASRRHVFRSGPAAAGRKVRSVAGSVAPRAVPPINPSPRGVHWASEAHSLGAAGCTHWPTHSADISFSSPPRPSPRPSAAPPGRSDPSIQEPEGKGKGVNHERRGGFVVAEPGRAALHPGGAAAGGGLLAAVVGPHHHHRLVPRPLVPRARPPGRDGRAARRGQPPARRRGPLLRRPAPAGPRRRRPSARRRRPQDR